MRRSDLLRGVLEVVNTLEVTNVAEVLAKSTGSGKSDQQSEDNVTRVLEALKSYTLHARTFSREGSRVATILRLSVLESPLFWSRVASEKGRLAAHRTFTDVRFAIEYLPRLVELLTEGSREILNEVSKGDAGHYPGKEVLTILVIEAENRFSTPARLAAVLESVSTLYEACATLHGFPGNDLSVLACDSGSDKSFDFLGAAKVIECVKDLILSMWDRVVFYRELQVSQRYKLVAESLPILASIKELEGSGAMQPEQAELLRRKILTGAGNFLIAGAVIPELRQRSEFSPHTLMAPAPKLIGPPVEPVDTEELDRGSQKTVTDALHEIATETVSLESLSSAERTVLQKLLGRLHAEGGGEVDLSSDEDV